MMEYLGPEHVHGKTEDTEIVTVNLLITIAAERTTPVVKTFADFIKPEYYYR